MYQVREYPRKADGQSFLITLSLKLGSNTLSLGIRQFTK